MGFRRAWARFGSAGTTLGPTPGVREDWHRGRRWYHVWVLRVADPRVRERRDAVFQDLGAAVSPFGADHPHVTVWVHGFDAPRFVHPLEGSEVPLSVGDASAFRAAPFLEVRGRLDPLRAAFPGPEERWTHYLPHLTVGSFVGGVDTAAVRARLRLWRGIDPLPALGTFTHCVLDAFDPAGALYDVPVTAGVELDPPQPSSQEPPPGAAPGTRVEAQGEAPPSAGPPRRS